MEEKVEERGLKEKGTRLSLHKLFQTPPHDMRNVGPAPTVLVIIALLLYAPFISFPF
jgi:hypothetical protein